jgi:hypothetical protein
MAPYPSRIFSSGNCKVCAGRSFIWFIRVLFMGVHFGKKGRNLEDAGEIEWKEAFRAVSPESL